MMSAYYIEVCQYVAAGSLWVKSKTEIHKTNILGYCYLNPVCSQAYYTVSWAIELIFMDQTCLTQQLAVAARVFFFFAEISFTRQKKYFNCHNRSVGSQRWVGALSKYALKSNQSQHK